MAIEKQMTPFDVEIEEEGAEELQVEIVNPEAISMETEDGGIIIDFEGDIAESIIGGDDHDANLAEVIDEDTLKSMASELLGDFEADRESRSEWARAYVKGLDLLGMKVEDRQQPWAGASGVFHPLLTEAFRLRQWVRYSLRLDLFAQRLLGKLHQRKPSRRLVSRTR